MKLFLIAIVICSTSMSFSADRSESSGDSAEIKDLLICKNELNNFAVLYQNGSIIGDRILIIKKGQEMDAASYVACEKYQDQNMLKFSCKGSDLSKDIALEVNTKNLKAKLTMKHLFYHTTIGLNCIPSKK